MLQLIPLKCSMLKRPQSTTSCACAANVRSRIAAALSAPGALDNAPASPAAAAWPSGAHLRSHRAASRRARVLADGVAHQRLGVCYRIGFVVIAEVVVERARNVSPFASASLASSVLKTWSKIGRTARFRVANASPQS